MVDDIRVRGDRLCDSLLSLAQIGKTAKRIPNKSP